MRTAWSRLMTKILPSPIWPVLAAEVMAFDGLVRPDPSHSDLDLDLGQEADGVSAPR